MSVCRIIINTFKHEATNTNTFKACKHSDKHIIWQKVVILLYLLLKFISTTAKIKINSYLTGKENKK